MAKSSTVIKKVQTDLVDFTSEGVLLLTEDGNLVIETDDYGTIDLVDILGELQLVNQPVKIKVVRKLEDAEEFSPLDIQKGGDQQWLNVAEELKKAVKKVVNVKVANQ